MKLPRIERPQIRPAIFLALQNGLAIALFASLLGAEWVRRLLYEHPQSELLWRLAALSNRTVMPVLNSLDDTLPNPDRLMMALLAGILVPLLAWLTRYWFATAVAGHVTLAAFVVMTWWAFRRGNLALVSADASGALMAMRPEPVAFLFLGISLLLLVMCVADHWAFIRFMATLFRRKPAAGA